ncbi:hypothetical protein AK812_SmicGene2272 [Symbiodinium microadriaticum]|uniref:Uncharacterized protein n=1 Tax=Symbiodinium microadriaticum TaxID=2951 RepID=A0A1Q9F1Z9_SYMMI|nr:hypothetical protein AK812_SmicGene2272 [Symbiodinium microadriaticum]
MADTSLVLCHSRDNCAIDGTAPARSWSAPEFYVAGLTGWVAPLTVSGLLNDQCVGAWRWFWKPCDVLQASSLEFRANGILVANRDDFCTVPAKSDGFFCMQSMAELALQLLLPKLVYDACWQIVNLLYPNWKRHASRCLARVCRCCRAGSGIPKPANWEARMAALKIQSALQLALLFGPFVPVIYLACLLNTAAHLLRLKGFPMEISENGRAAALELEEVNLGPEDLQESPEATFHRFMGSQFSISVLLRFVVALLFCMAMRGDFPKKWDASKSGAMVRVLALCAMFVASSAQSCGVRLPGIYNSCAYECSPYDSPTPSECCDKCRTNTGCLGICIAKVPGVGSYPGGQGDIVDGPGHCVVDGNSLDDDDCHMPLAQPQLQDGQVVYNKGQGNDLGRPGRCSADPYFRVAGKELRLTDASGNSVSSVGACCDLCAETPGCGGWTVEMAQSPWQCRLFQGEAVHADVKYARIQRNFKAELKRLEINIVDQSPSDEVWRIINKDLKRDEDGRELPGVAPGGDLERQLQRFLDEVNGITGSVPCAGAVWAMHVERSAVVAGGLYSRCQGKTLVEPWGPWPPEAEDSWVPAWPSALKDACTATDPEEEHLQADLSEDCDSDWAAAIRAALPEPEGGFPSEAFSSYSPTACPDSGTSQEEYLAKLEQRLDSLRRVPKRSAVPWREGHQAFRLLGLGTQAALAFRGMATESAQQGSAQTFDAGRFGRWLRMMLVSFYTDEEAAVADALSITMSGGYTNGSAEGRREYDHPIVILGGGMGGLMTAVDFLRQNRKDFIILERYDAFGGTTWRDVANETTKLQTEKGTYVPEYLDPEVHADEDQKTWPSRDSILDMCVACAEKHGLEDKAKFNTSLEKVEVKGDLLAGGHIELSITTEDSSETLKCSALVSCPGVFYNPIDLKWPGREEFGGYITHGSYDGINYDKLKDATVCIVGHGGFTIENVRTCVERKSKKIYIVCRHRHLAGPKMVSWMVSGAAVPIPGPFIVEAFQKMYGLLGVDIWSHPVVNANADRSSAVLTQTTTFGVTDIYFLACYYKVCEVVHGEIDKLSKGKVHLKDGKELECNVIMKCLGSHGATDFDDIIGFKFYQGWWVNGEPLMPCMAPAKGVQAKNFAGFSLAPGYAGQIITNRYFIDHPEKFLGVRDWLPKQNRDEHYECNYIYKGAHVLATMVILQTQFPDLAGELAEADKLKAYKHIKAHPLEKHLDECLAEWKMYIKMMKDHGQIPADAEEVEYPYTKENLLELDQRCQEALKAEWEKMMAKKAKAGKYGYAAVRLDAVILLMHERCACAGSCPEEEHEIFGLCESQYRQQAMMKDVSLARALQLPDRQVRQVLERRLVPDCIVDKCSEGTGEKLQAFYRISPVAVAVAAQRFQLLEMSLSAQTQEQYVCKECNRVYDTMQAMSTSFSCECGQALASTAEESEARRDRLHRYKSTANMVRSRSVTGAVVTAFGLAFVACRLGGAFVGSSPQLRGGSQVARRVGVDYLLRNGPKDADPPLMDPNTASGATHEIEFKKKPFGILRYAPGPGGNGAVVREVKQESRYPGDPQGQAFVAGVQPGWVVASVNGQDAKNIKFEDLMEFMDDEVLDPVAALSLNLKENGVSSEGKGIGESTFTFGGGNLAPLPIKVVYQEPCFHVQCKELLKLTQELENLPGPQFGHPPKVKKPRGAAKQSAKAKAAASEQRPAPADDIQANQMQVDIASTLQSKDSEDAQVPPADTAPALSAEQEISKTVEEEVGAHNQSTRTSLEARLRGTQRSQPQEVHEDPIVVVRGEPLPLSRVLADDDLQEQMTDQEYQRWLETGGFRPILRWIVPGSWSPATRLRLARTCRATQVERLSNHDCTQAPRFRARIWLPEPTMKHVASLAGLAIVLAAVPAGALKAYQTTGLQSLDSVLGSLQQRLSAGRTQLDDVEDLTDMARNAAPESFAPVLANMGKYTQRWREDLAAEKEAADQRQILNTVQEQREEFRVVGQRLDRVEGQTGQLWISRNRSIEVDFDWKGRVWYRGAQVLFHADRDPPVSQALMMLDARGLFLQLRFGAAPFALASLHLPHDQREDAFDVWTSTIEHVTQALGNVPVGHPVMIGGDFNQPLNTAQDTFSPMAQLRLLIARFRLRITEDVGPTWHARGLEAPLDFLLFRHEGMLGSAIKREDLRLALPSDHDLVLTHFHAAPRARDRNRIRRDRCGRWSLQTEQWDSALAQLPDDPSEADLSAAFQTCSFRPKFPRYRDSELVRDLIRRRKISVNIDERTALAQEIACRRAEDKASFKQVAGSYIQARGGQDAAAKVRTALQGAKTGTAAGSDGVTYEALLTFAAGQFACRKGSQAIDGAAAASLLLQIGHWERDRPNTDLLGRQLVIINNEEAALREIGLNLRLRYNTFDRQAMSPGTWSRGLPALYGGHGDGIWLHDPIGKIFKEALNLPVAQSNLHDVIEVLDSQDLSFTGLFVRKSVLPLHADIPEALKTMNEHLGNLKDNVDSLTTEEHGVYEAATQAVLSALKALEDRLWRAQKEFKAPLAGAQAAMTQACQEARALQAELQRFRPLDVPRCSQDTDNTSSFGT